MPVRTQLLEVYEKYYLPLRDDLMPCLRGFVLGLLPGLEDESEHTDRWLNVFSLSTIQLYSMGVVL